MNTPKFHKLYFPGLISLIGLPIMCICYLINNGTFHKYQAMNVMWLNNDGLKDWMKYSPAMPNLLTFRKYEELSVTGSTVHDNSEINKLKFQFNQLLASNDTINGIRVAFGVHAKYEEVITVLDVCFASKNQNFGLLLLNNKALIFHAPPQKNIVAFTKGCLLCDDVGFIKHEEPLISFEKIKEDAKNIYKILIRFWPSALGYTLMLCFTIFKKRLHFSENTI